MGVGVAQVRKEDFTLGSAPAKEPGVRQGGEKTHSLSSGACKRILREEQILSQGTELGSTSPAGLGKGEGMTEGARSISCQGKKLFPAAS